MAGKEPKPARITLDYLERYGNGIDGVASEAASEFEPEARSVIASHGDPSQWADADRDAIRDDVAGLMERYVGTYDDAVQAIASNAFEGVLEAQGAPDGVPIADVDMSQRAAASSRYWAGSLWGDAPDADAYVAGCSSFVDRHVRHSADYCLLEAASGSRHRKKLRYARVPQGPTCGFCTMLASRGFVNASKESAGELGQFHDGCNCLIVAGFDGLEVEGYDYRGMYERYESCRDSIGPAEDIWRDFQELPPAERDAYGRKPRAMLAEIPQSLLNEIGGNANAFNDYYAHRICREMDTRDRRWLHDGTVPPIDYSSSPRETIGWLRKRSEEFNPSDYSDDNIIKGSNENEWRDLFAYDALANNGFNVKKRVDRAVDSFGNEIDGVTNPDIEIDGVIWEIKSPHPRKGGASPKPGNELKFLNGQLREAFDNFENPYDEAGKTGMGDMRRETCVVINLLYKNPNRTWDKGAVMKKIESEMKSLSGNDRVVKEVICIFPDGSIAHM